MILDFNAEQLEEAIEKYFEDKGPRWSDSFDWWNNGAYEPIEVEGFGTVTAAEYQGMHKVVAGEAAGDYTEWEVFVIVKVNNRFFGKFGVDSSWDSPGLGKLVEVQPVQKTITVWEKTLDYG